MRKKYTCNHKPESIAALAKSPFESGVRNFNTISKYFMYYAPNIECRLSRGRIEAERANEVFQKMITAADMHGKYKILKKVQKVSWNELELDGDMICLQCSRMTFGQREEESLTALLRHIRNAFAHGLVYVKKRKNKPANILLEDKNGNRRLTARIVMTIEQLEKWKAILENEVPIGE